MPLLRRPVDNVIIVKSRFGTIVAAIRDFLGLPLLIASKNNVYTCTVDDLLFHTFIRVERRRSSFFFFIRFPVREGMKVSPGLENYDKLTVFILSLGP